MDEHNKCKNCAWYGEKRKGCGISMKTRDGEATPCKHFEMREDIAQSICSEQNPPTQTHDPVEHPKHYTHGGIECIDAVKAALGKNFIGFLIGNVLKYLWRYPHKNGVEDLKKAQWYLDRAIKEMEHESE